MLNWLIDWMLPAWFWNGVIFVGIAAIIASWGMKFFPGVSVYKTPVAILGIIVTMAGIYHLGAANNEEKWKQKEAALQARISELENQGPIIVKEVEIRYKDRVETIAQKGDTITAYITNEITKYDPICPIPKEVVKAHNAAATGQAIGGTK